MRWKYFKDALKWSYLKSVRLTSHLSYLWRMTLFPTLSHTHGNLLHNIDIMIFWNSYIAFLHISPYHFLNPSKNPKILYVNDIYDHSNSTWGWIRQISDGDEKPFQTRRFKKIIRVFTYKVYFFLARDELHNV